jgi:outer membrane protein assembly factor BamB
MKANILKKILIAFLLLCFISFFILTSSICLAQDVDGIKLLESKKEFLQIPEGVKQVWDIQTNDEEIDQIIPFDESKLLLKTIHIKNFLLNYEYSNLSMINLEDGSIDWIFSTADLEQKNQNILTTKPLILIYASSDKKSGLYALNPTDGKLIWSYSIKVNSNFVVSDDNKNLFISYGDKDKVIIENLSLKDGTIIWNNVTPYESDKTYNFPRLIIARNLYLILGETIMALNKNDGKLIWKDILKDGINSYFASDENLWFYNYHEIISIGQEDGKIQNRFLFANKYLSIATIYKNMLLVSTYDSIKQEHALVCNDLKSLKTNWSFTLGSSLKSVIYNEDNEIYFTTEKAFYKIDINSGTLITNIVLADTVKATTLAFDIIEKRGENLIIGKENTMFILSEKEPSKNISIHFGIYGGFTPSYLQNKIIELKLGGIPERSKSTYNMMNYSSNMTFTGISRQYQNWVFSSTASTLSYNSNATHTERISALDRREQAVRNSYNTGRTEAYTQLAMASGQFGSAIGSGIAALSQAMNKAALFHTIDYIEEKLKASISYQSKCINDNFYIRPYFDNGWRLAVFDIHKYGYASIPMIPDLLPLRFSCTTGSVVYSVMSKGNKQYLLIKGLRPKKQDPKKVYDFKFVNPDIGKLSKWTLPNPCLICYDITDIGTNNEYPVLKSIEANARPIDKELIEAAFFDNVKRVEELLKRGANVNAQDEYGHTALMHACLVVDDKKVKILLEAGANPWVGDPEGFIAFTYSTLEFPPFNKELKDVWELLGKAMK